MRQVARMSMRGAVLAAAAIILASCTVVVDDDRPGPIRPGDPDFCPRVYDPVCGRRGGDRQTFPNSCEADRAGYRIISGGECRRGGDRPGRPDFDRPGRPDRGERFCTREYAPVCARRGPNVRTFGNSCEADSAGFRIVSRGPC